MEKVAATSAYSEPSVTARMVIWNISKKKGGRRKEQEDEEKREEERCW